MIVRTVRRLFCFLIVCDDDVQCGLRERPTAPSRTEADWNEGLCVLDIMVSGIAL